MSAILMLIFGSCGPDAQTDAAQETIPKYTLPPVIRESVPAVGGEIVFPAPKQNTASLNPLKAKNVELYNMLSLIYEQPVRIGTDGKAQSELAETWKVDETGMVWTFKLRQGVQWQDGYGEMTAADVKYTIDQIMNDPDSSYAHNKDLIATYTALDDYTINISLV